MSITVPQVSPVASSSGTTTTVATMGSAIGAGSAVAAIVTYSTGFAGISAPTASGMTFNQIVVCDQNFDVSVELWLALNVTGGGKTVTANHTNVGAHSVQLLEITGLVSSGSAADGTNFSTANRTTSINPGSVTPTSGNDIILISSASDSRGDTYSGPSGYTVTANSGGVIKVGYKIVTGPSGSYTGVWTAPNTYGDASVIIAALKAAGSAPKPNSGFFHFMRR